MSYMLKSYIRNIRFIWMQSIWSEIGIYKFLVLKIDLAGKRANKNKINCPSMIYWPEKRRDLVNLLWGIVKCEWKCRTNVFQLPHNWYIGVIRWIFNPTNFVLSSSFRITNYLTRDFHKGNECWYLTLLLCVCPFSILSWWHCFKLHQWIKGIYFVRFIIIYGLCFYGGNAHTIWNAWENSN